MPPSVRPRIACFFASADRDLADALKKHLKISIDSGKLSYWGVSDVKGGQSPRDEIQHQLKTADVLLFLTSAELFDTPGASDWIRFAAHRRQTQGTPVIPILLRPVAMAGSPLEDLKPLPEDGRPIARWAPRDEGWVEVIKGILKVIEAPPKPAQPAAKVHKPPRDLWAPDADFIGREDELAKSSKAFRSALTKQQAAICVLHGPGGMGKTQLALVIAQGLGDRFPGGQIFVDLAGSKPRPSVPLSDREAIETVLSALGVDKEVLERAPISELRRRYCQLASEKPVLIFADDASDAGQLRSLKPPPGSVLLVTSRVRFDLDGSCAVAVGELQATESRQLARILCPDLTDFEEAAIHEACGGCPLALRIVCARLSASSGTQERAAWLNRLAEGGALQVDAAEGEDRSLMHSLRWSYELLSPPVQAVFRVLGVFSASFDVVAAAAVVAKGEVDLHASLQELQQYCLVQEIEQSGGHRYRLYDVVRSLAVSLLAASPDAQKAAYLRMSRHFARVLQNAEAMYINDVLYLEHKDEAAGPSSADKVSVKALSVPDMDTDDSPSLVTLIPAEMIGNVSQIQSLGLAWFDLERANIMAGQRWAAESFHVYKPAAEVVLEYVGHVAFIFMVRLSEDELKRWHGAAAQAAQSIQDPLHRGLAIGNLAQVLIEQNELTEAERLLESVKQDLRVSENDRNAVAVDSMFGLLRKAQGKHLDAIACFQRSLLGWERLADVKGRGNDLCNMGLAYQELKEFDTAIALFLKSIEFSRQAYNIQSESNALSALASAYQEKGATDKAVEAIENSLGLRRKLRDAKGIRPLLGELASLLMDRGQAGDIERALELLEEQRERLAHLPNLLARGSLATAWSHSGKCYAKLGRFAEAISAYRQSLAIAQALDKPPASLLGVTAANLGAAYAELAQRDSHDSAANYEEAVRQFSAALIWIQQTEDLESEANIEMNLGAVKQSCGDRANQLGARDNIQRAIELSARVGKLEQLSAAHRQMGIYCQKMGEPANAVVHWQKRAELEARLARPQQRFLALLEVGKLYLDTGSASEALRHLSLVSSLSREGFGSSAAEGLVIQSHLFSELGIHATQEKSRAGLHKVFGCFRRSAALAHAAGAVEEEAVAISNAGEAIYRLGRRRSGRILGQRALGMLQDIGSLKLEELRRDQARWDDPM